MYTLKINSKTWYQTSEIIVLVIPNTAIKEQLSSQDPDDNEAFLTVNNPVPPFTKFKEVGPVTGTISKTIPNYDSTFTKYVRQILQEIGLL